MGRSYSYTTVMVEPDGSARTSAILYPDESARVLCSVGGERAQVSVVHAGADVLFAPTHPTAPTTEDVRVARSLAVAFAEYAAEVERLHNESTDGASGSDGERAA